MSISLEEKMFKALNLAYFEAGYNGEKESTAQQDADIYIRFAWPGSTPNSSNAWKPFPSKIEINHVLFHLNEKKSFLSKAIIPRNWLEKKVANDYKYYKYYLETGIIESMIDGKQIRILFDGRKLRHDESIKYNFLRVTISKKLFLLCFADIPF